jgi:nicotinate-nucleotide adenylyltransferase
MRVAIFGGSFNPPHLAHQMAALYVLETEPVDELWLIPTFRHPFGKALAPFEHRLAMCEAAAAALGPRVRVSAVERELGEESRTLRTIRRLQADFPGHVFSLVIGADLVAEIPSWFGSAELTQAVPFIVVGRAGFEAASSADRVALPRVSSSEVRAALAAGRSAAGLVPRTVLDYIYRHDLYNAGPHNAGRETGQKTGKEPA